MEIPITARASSRSSVAVRTIRRASPKYPLTITTSAFAALIFVTSVVRSGVRKLYGTFSPSSIPSFLA